MAALICKIAREEIADISIKSGSIECQQFLVLHLGYSKGYGKTSTNNYSIGCLWGPEYQDQYRYCLLKIGVNGASTMFGVAPWIIQGLCNGVNTESNYRPPLWAKMVSTIFQPPHNNERQHSINRFPKGAVSCTTMYCTALFLNHVISHLSSVSVSIFNFPNMHAMSHQSDF